MVPSQQLLVALEGRYEIEREIGAGGMATVYLARDLRHERLVALKVLRPELGAVLGVERFLSEIRVTANLQHPHLLPLFDSGEAGGMLYYVMPYVPGESLRVRLDREKQLSVQEAVRLAAAVAGALDYAHRHQVVHRDLKPENILLQDGEPVVSDFGIALAVSNAGGARITQTGLSLGTPAYMSPEQAAGDRVIDARSDVYSLGAVLYEMLIGEPPHTGSSVQQVISRILTEEPRRIVDQRPAVPLSIAMATHRALARIPADRFPTARAFADALRAEPHLTAPAIARGRTIAASTRRDWRAVAPWLLGGALAGAAIALGWRPPTAASPEAPYVRFVVEPPGGLKSEFAELALSMNGLRMALADGPPGARRIWLRTLGEDDMRELPALANAQSLFLSPDGSSLGYFADGRLSVVPTDGGSPTVLATIGDRPFRSSASWSSTGVIVYSRPDSTGLWAVDIARRTVRRVTTPNASLEDDGAPAFLPGSTRFLFERRTRGSDGPTVWLGDVGGTARSLDLVGSAPQFVAGYLVVATPEGTLSATAFDTSRGKAGETAVSLFSFPVASRGPRRTAIAASASGILSYIEATSRRTHLVIVDRLGSPRVVGGTARSYGSPSLSPDGGSVAVEVVDASRAGESDIWIFDQGGTSRRVTRGLRAFAPVWTQRGDALVYATQGSERGPATVFLQRLAIPESSQRVYTGQGLVRPLAISPEGDSVRAVEFAPRSGPRLVSINIRDGGVNAYASGDGERGASVSPDGRWIVYAGTEDGRTEIFIRPSAATSPVTRLSDSGGDLPRWSRDGSSLVYRDSSSFVAVQLALTPTPRVTGRTVLMPDAYERSGMSSYDVGVGGQMVLLRADEPGSHVDVIVNAATFIRARMAASSSLGGARP